jgi:DNA-binding beta-propeller fold protein YncE
LENTILFSVTGIVAITILFIILGYSSHFAAGFKPGNAPKTKTLPPVSDSARVYQFVRSWGSEGSGKGEFRSPNVISIDSSGNIYVTDFDNFRIQKFDSNGRYITECGSFGQG